MKRFNFRAVATLFCIFGLILAAGCGGKSFVKTSYDGLVISYQSYDATMKSAADMFKRGLIGETDKANIIKYGKAYKTAHNSAVNALAAYAASDKSTEQSKKDAYLRAASDASTKLADLVALVNQLKNPPKGSK